MSAANANRIIHTTPDQGVDLHAGLTLLLQQGNAPSQAKRISIFSMFQQAADGSSSMKKRPFLVKISVRINNRAFKLSVYGNCMS